MRLLVKNLGRCMPESVVREKIESLNIRVEGVTQLGTGRRDQNPAKDCLPTPHLIVSVARGREVSKVGALNELCGFRVLVELYVATKGALQCKRCQHFGHTQRNCGYALRCVVCGGSHYPTGTPSAEQMDLGEEWNQVVRGGRVVKASANPTQIQIRHSNRSWSGPSSLK